MIPLGFRSKIIIPSDSSSSFIARLRFGCPIYRFSAALLIDFVFATSTAYFKCRIFIRTLSPELNCLQYSIYYDKLQVDIKGSYAEAYRSFFSENTARNRS